MEGDEEQTWRLPYRRQVGNEILRLEVTIKVAHGRLSHAWGGTEPRSWQIGPRPQATGCVARETDGWLQMLMRWVRVGYLAGIWRRVGRGVVAGRQLKGKLDAIDDDEKSRATEKQTRKEVEGVKWKRNRHQRLKICEGVISGRCQARSP